MSKASERRYAVVAAALILTAAAWLGGCGADDPISVNVAAPQARVVVTFPELAGKAEGDFDLELTLRVHEGREGEVELQRTIEVHGWVTQGVLEVPPRVMVMVEARTELDGRTYTGFGQVLPLEPGAATTLQMELFSR